MFTRYLMRIFSVFFLCCCVKQATQTHLIPTTNYLLFTSSRAALIANVGFALASQEHIDRSNNVVFTHTDTYNYLLYYYYILEYIINARQLKSHLRPSELEGF